MKEYIKTIPFTTLAIFFLFICGGLYLLGYWTTFNVDIANIASLIDIPKSFIFPFAISGIATVVHVFVMNDIFTEEENAAKNLDPQKLKNKEHINFVLYLLFFSVLFGGYKLFREWASYWYVAGLLISTVLTIKVARHTPVKQYILNNHIRAWVVTFLIWAPITSFCLGKGKAYEVVANSDIKYIRINTSNNNVVQNDSSSLKLLGFLGDKLIVSSLDNKRVYFLNQSEFNTVKMERVGVEVDYEDYLKTHMPNSH